MHRRSMAIGIFVGLVFGALVMRRVVVYRGFPPVPESAKELHAWRVQREILGHTFPPLKKEKPHETPRR